MKQILLFTLSFAALSLFLTWLWLSGGRASYGAWMSPLAVWVGQLFDLPSAGTMYRSRFINLVPFTSLVLLTPRLSLLRRFGGLLLGWLLLMISHLALNAFAVASAQTGSLPPTASLLSDAMPFVLWFFVAREFVRSLMQQVRPTQTDSEPTDS